MSFSAYVCDRCSKMYETEAEVEACDHNKEGYDHAQAWNELQERSNERFKQWSAEYDKRKASQSETPAEEKKTVRSWGVLDVATLGLGRIIERIV